MIRTILTFAAFCLALAATFVIAVCADLMLVQTL